VVVLAWLLVASACAGGGDSSLRTEAPTTPEPAASAPAPDGTSSTDRSSSPSPSDGSSGEPPGSARIDDAVLVGYADDTAVADEAFAVLATITTADAGDVLTPASEAIATGQSLLPEGADLIVRRETWERTGRIGAVVVEVHMGEGPPDEFVAFLVATADGWRLSHTERVEP
jgi:hypothetical protein